MLTKGKEVKKNNERRVREGELNAVEEVQAWGIAPRLSSSAAGSWSHYLRKIL